MPQSHHHIVIMAGGVGSRFWPMSTSKYPKQFIDVLGVGRSLIQLTYDRFSSIAPKENVWVVTHRDYAETIMEQLPDINPDHILCEPCRRNTAPCIAYVSYRIKKEDPTANVVVTPSDHVVTDVAEFRRVVSQCMDFTAETDAIITLGIRPTRPETGYGYIQADTGNVSARNHEIFRVDSFREKPDLTTAQAYLRSGMYYWNAGIFIWNVHTIVNAFRVYEPSISDLFESIFDDLGTDRERDAIDRIYPECENISVDYAIMEKAEEIFVCPASFGWSDLGTWNSLYEQTPKDLYGNASIGDTIKLIDTRNCMVHAKTDRPIVIEGLDDCIVALKDGALLICKRSEEQRIKQFYQE